MVFCDRKDVLDELSTTEVIRTRLDDAGIVFVTYLVQLILLRPTVINKALTPGEKIIITLR